MNNLKVNEPGRVRKAARATRNAMRSTADFFRNLGGANALKAAVPAAFVAVAGVANAQNNPLSPNSASASATQNAGSSTTMPTQIGFTPIFDVVRAPGDTSHFTAIDFKRSERIKDVAIDGVDVVLEGQWTGLMASAPAINPLLGGEGRSPSMRHQVKLGGGFIINNDFKAVADWLSNINPDDTLGNKHANGLEVTVSAQHDVMGDKMGTVFGAVQGREITVSDTAGNRGAIDVSIQGGYRREFTNWGAGVYVQKDYMSSDWLTPSMATDFANLRFGGAGHVKLSDNMSVEGSGAWGKNLIDGQLTFRAGDLSVTADVMSVQLRATNRKALRAGLNVGFRLPGTQNK